MPRVPITGKAAIYTRVSTDRQQDGASLDVQLEQFREYCESNGFTIAAEFKDVLSGLKTDRPEYRQAVALARSRGVDKLVVWRLDRLGRDSGEYITQLRDLRKLGITVVSVTQPGESVLMQELMGVLAAEESRQLSVRITASKRRRSSEGKWNGAAPLGYSAQTHPDGGRVLVPNDDAALVTQLFKRYATGKQSLRNLRDLLNEHGHVVTYGSIWYLLKNPVYTGMIRHGHWSHSEVMPGPKEVTFTKGLHRPLVDPATFDKVQARMAANKSRRNGGPSPRYLFSGLVFCGQCGYRYTAKRTSKGDAPKVVYYCNRASSAGDCTAHSLIETRLREAVLGPLQILFAKLNQKAVRTMVRDELLLQRAALEASADAERTKLEASETRLSVRLTKLEDLYLDGGMSKDRYLERRDRDSAELEAIKAQLADRPKVVRPDTDQLFAIADSLMASSPNDEEWREIVGEMVDRVVIGKKVEVQWKPEWQAVFAVPGGKR